ncbi:unnamed protein product [Durusdinium trenchii]|uniref:Uncharacterized protein n=1 Tax=Durusdinium trenchii TaxID=1381693 RepID=A0ABP0M2D2_9DINO
MSRSTENAGASQCGKGRCWCSGAIWLSLVFNGEALAVVKVTRSEVNYQGLAEPFESITSATSESLDNRSETVSQLAATRGAVVSIHGSADNSADVSLAMVPAYYVKRRYSFPTIRRGANVSDVFSPFAKVRTRMVPVQPHNTFATAVDVEIATPEIIVSVYLLLYVPLAMAWAYFVHFGCKEKHYLILVPFTLCAFTVGLDLVNQSLSTLTAAPMAMTAIQAGFMFASTMLWTMGCHIYMLLRGATPTVKSYTGERSPSRVPYELTLYPLSCSTQTQLLFGWTPAAFWFVAYQLINHEVSMYCSLSERTVFLNLCPLFALFIEPLVLPSRVANVLNQTFSSKMALITMAFGAVLFSLQYPDFSANGVRSAGLLVALVLPYRLLQRMLLADCQDAPATLLCAWDGLLLTIPAAILTVLNEKFFIEAWSVWLHNPSIMLMFGLSIFAFIGNHLAVLYLLKATSATSTLVFGNLSNFVVVFEGIVFFSDPVFEAPLVFTGIALSLLGGIWYAIDQQEETKVLEEETPRVQESPSS